MNAPSPPAPAGVTIQMLARGDGALLAALNALFGEAFEDRPTYAGAPPGDAYLESLLARDTFIAVVARASGAVIGGLVAYELPKAEQRRSEIYLYDLAVAEAWRRRGVATALIRELQALAAARGAWVVFVQADHSDPPAIALYTKLGVREDVLHFDVPPRPRA